MHQESRTPAARTTVAAIGFWSGLLTFVFAVVYGIAQIAAVFGAFTPP